LDIQYQVFAYENSTNEPIIQFSKEKNLQEKVMIATVILNFVVPHRKVVVGANEIEEKSMWMMDEK
jgi:hypothetical protein